MLRGANVKHRQGPNVGGTLEVLRLATRRRLKPVHFISTLSVIAPPAARRASGKTGAQQADNTEDKGTGSPGVSASPSLSVSSSGSPSRSRRYHAVCSVQRLQCFASDGSCSRRKKKRSKRLRGSPQLSVARPLRQREGSHLHILVVQSSSSITRTPPKENYMKESDPLPHHTGLHEVRAAAVIPVPIVTQWFSRATH